MSKEEQSKGLEALLESAEQQDKENPVEVGNTCNLGEECENCGS